MNYLGAALVVFIIGFLAGRMADLHPVYNVIQALAASSGGIGILWWVDRREE